MKTDKLFYRIFLNQPSLIGELLPEIPPDCQFEYSASVVKKLVITYLNYYYLFNAKTNFYS